MFLYAKPQIELKMLDMSARSLGEAEDETETDANKLKEKQANHARWEARGAEIKAEMHESLLYSFMPDHMQAMRTYLRGRPNDEKMAVVEPLSGISQGVARSLLDLIQKQTFSRGAWAKNRLHEQLKADDGLARRRLEKTAEGEG